MTSFKTRTTTLLTAAAAFLLLLPAAKDAGCGDNEVVIGDDGTGGSSDGGSSDGGSSDGGEAAGGHAPGVECYIGGCNAEICSAIPGVPSACVWLPEYACYHTFGMCEADTYNLCGWRDTPALQHCLQTANREPFEGGCARDNDDPCETDADCVNGGCGGELCFNPAVSEGISSCDCTVPAATGCGCVLGTCSWYN